MVDNPAVRNAVQLIDKVYEESRVAGPLHVIVDDFNVEDEFFSAETEAACSGVFAECFAALKALSVKERASALALHDGFWGLP